MARPVTHPAGTPARPVVAAALADAAVVAVFVVLGRRSHEQAATITGFVATAAPFWFGAAAGWLVCRAWRRPAALVPTGLAVWVAAVAVGMVLRRVVGGDGTATSFVVVATAFLAAGLLGWRAVVTLRAKLGSRHRLPQKS